MIQHLSNEKKFNEIFQVIMMPPFIAPKTEVKVKELSSFLFPSTRVSSFISRILGTLDNSLVGQSCITAFAGGNCCPRGNNQDSLRCSSFLGKFQMVSSVINFFLIPLIYFSTREVAGGYIGTDATMIKMELSEVSIMYKRRKDKMERQ